jgi:cytochrome oxidase assembly protein ShyY1
MAGAESYRRGVLRTLRTRRYVVLLIILIFVAGGCFAAGVWQVHRYGWKHSANTALDRDAADATTPAGDLLAPGRPVGKDLQFRTVTTRGRYDVGGQLLVRQREVDDGPAFLVVTPLRTDAGPTLLVVRGWVAMTGAAARTPAVPAPPTGQVAVTARIYPSEPAGRTRGIPAGQIERIDTPAIARRLGVPTYGGYAELISQTPATAKLAVLPGPDLSNPAGGASEPQHLAYVFQWFLFGLLALAAPFLLARLEVRRGEQAPRQIAAPVANHTPTT